MIKKNFFYKLFSMVFLLILHSCSYFSLYQNAFIAGRGLLKNPSFEITDTIKNIPYAMQLVTHKDSSIVMVLAEANNNHLVWVDSENNQLITMHGKITSSLGLRNDLETINSPDILSIFKEVKDRPSEVIEKRSFIRFLNPESTFMESIHIFSLQESNEKFLKLKIDNSMVEYKILKEMVEIPSISWNYINYYWIAVEGKVLRSKQYITPDQPRYFLETLKDYSP